MTTMVQTFVSPDEIISLRFQCSCRAVIALPLTKESSDKLPAEMECPSCSKKWFEGVQDQRRVALVSFMGLIVQLQSFKDSSRLDIMLEIANLPSEFQKSAGQR